MTNKDKVLVSRKTLERLFEDYDYSLRTNHEDKRFIRELRGLGLIERKPNKKPHYYKVIREEKQRAKFLFDNYIGEICYLQDCIDWAESCDFNLIEVKILGRSPNRNFIRVKNLHTNKVEDINAIEITIEKPNENWVYQEGYGVYLTKEDHERRLIATGQYVDELEI